jgi:hypothetical protein
MSRKLGLLMDDDKIERCSSISHAMEKFILMRRSEFSFIRGFRPIRIMERIDGVWVPLVPDAVQIKKCLQMVTTLAFQFEQMKGRENDRPRGY